MKRPMSVPRAGHLVFSQQGLQGRVGVLGTHGECLQGRGLACWLCASPCAQHGAPYTKEMRNRGSWHHCWNFRGVVCCCLLHLVGTACVLGLVPGTSHVYLPSFSQHPHFAGEKTEAHRG